MNTKSLKKKKTTKSVANKNNGKANSSIKPVQKPESVWIKLELIDPPKFNYRQIFDEQYLNELAADIKRNNLINPITVRPIEGGRYQLAIGECRYRAANIAQVEEVPVLIKVLTDDEMEELQFSENIHRKDPHPMEEANGIGRRLAKKMNVNEIATLLGKSKQYVYLRVKLLNLIPSIQQMYLHNKVSFQQACELAGISQDSQTELYDKHWTNWQDKNFQIYNLSNMLSNFRCDLNRAPFNTKDKSLLPEAGACTNCPFNSASLKSLFPELAKKAVCSNSSCFQKKCEAGISQKIMSLITEHKPEAFIGDYDELERLEEAIVNLPEEYHLPTHKYYEVTVVRPPEMPDKENYSGLQWGNDEESDEQDDEGFNKKEYEDDMEYYHLKLNEFNDNKSNGTYKVALLLDEGNVEIVLFSPEPSTVDKHPGNNTSFTMKFLEDAIKTKTATPNMIEKGIQLLEKKEDRAIELDREKIQLKIYNKMQERCNNGEETVLTEADQLATRLIIYESLPFSGRSTAANIVFDNNLQPDDESKKELSLLQKLKNLNDSQFALLIRLAILFKSDSKFPNASSGNVLYQIAESSGIDVREIEEDQQEKATARAERLSGKVKKLESTKSKLLKLTEKTLLINNAHI